MRRRNLAVLNAIVSRHVSAAWPEGDRREARDDVTSAETCALEPRLRPGVFIYGVAIDSDGR